MGETWLQRVRRFYRGVERLAALHHGHRVGRNVHDHDVVVDRPHVAKHFSKIVDLLVVLGDQIQQIGIESQTRARDDRRDCDDQRYHDDVLASAETELCEAVEDFFDQVVLRAMVSARSIGG